MPNDDLPDYFPPPRKRPTAIVEVDPEDPVACADWCAELGVTAEVLSRAIELVGGMPNALRFYFRDGAPKVQQEWGRPQRSLRKREASDAPARLNPDSSD